MGKIFVVIGKSATGKDTIYKRLLDEVSLKLKTVVTYTTRPIRSLEQNGREYFFVDNKKREQLLAEGKVIEHRSYQTVHGIWHYFTVNDGQIDLSSSDYLMILTLEGFEQIRNYFGTDVVIPIYIEVEDGIRLQRALKREQEQAEPKYVELCRRFLADDVDFSDDNILSLGIHKRYQNTDIESCVKKISEDMKLLIE